MYLYSYLSFAPAPLLDIFSFYVCLGQLSRNRSLGGYILVQGGVMNSPIAPIGIARPMVLAIVTSREIYLGNFKWFHRAKLFRGFKW